MAVISRCFFNLPKTGAAFSTSTAAAKEHYRLLVVGGGAAGSGMSNKFAPRFGPGKVAVVEPSDTHYYQPMWTLIGAGIRSLEHSARPMSSVLNKSAVWIRDRAAQFHPDKNLVITEGGKELSYDYLVVCLGLQLRFDLIKGLPEALANNAPGVCTNYHKDYVMRTFKSLEDFKEGNAVFTFPSTPIKCAGAPQKIMYLAEEYFRNHGKRDKAQIMYSTSLGVIFGVKKYADALTEICKNRGITVNTRQNLTEIRADKREAVFDLLDENGKPTGEQKVVKYEMIHVGPPCSAPAALRGSPQLTDANGFLNVNKETLQHVKYPNIFGLGDCTNAPTSKTAAAISGQIGVVRKNLLAVINGKRPEAIYDGYTSCPLITGYNKCVMAEFDYNGEPMETFPINQGKERRTMFHMKKDMMPIIYWLGLVKGWWEGPKWIRKLLHLGMSR